MKRAFLAGSLFALLFILSGCVEDEDHRKTSEKLDAPKADVATRHVMACPKCRAPQRAFRVDAVKSYYKCSGLPPRFPHHDEKQWIHRISDHDISTER